MIDITDDNGYYLKGVENLSDEELRSLLVNSHAGDALFTPTGDYAGSSPETPVRDGLLPPPADIYELAITSGEQIEVYDNPGLIERIGFKFACWAGVEKLPLRVFLLITTTLISLIYIFGGF